MEAKRTPTMVLAPLFQDEPISALEKRELAHETAKRLLGPVVKANLWIQ